MTITLIQMDIRWGDIAANCRTASQQIDSHPGSDLYILPEMFSTGFAVNPEGLADTTGQTLEWMKEKALCTQAAICGSVAIRESDGTFRNRLYFVTPHIDEEAGTDTGSPLPYGITRTTHYDKHHLFTYGHEHKAYTPGSERVVINWRGTRFLLQICYDLRFPIFSRNNLGIPYDCILYVASWPQSRQDVWDTLLKARAIENQCYVAGINRIGTDPTCTYQGGTQLIDPYGRPCAQAPQGQTHALTYTLDTQALRAFRAKFPVLRDAD